MEQNISRAKECGQRCRRIRQAKGISQQALADRLGTSPQNISKYEKNGISDIDTIMNLSDILGQNLLEDETDAEGTVGEVGKEILYQMIKAGGYIFLKDARRKDFNLFKDMHGMSRTRINKEIFKLERIGMCVREQYNDFDNADMDVLFITAKGIISYRNIVGRESVDVTEVKSYEDIIGDNGSYQEFIDKHPEVVKVYELSNLTGGQISYDHCDNTLNYYKGYRHNFVAYILRKYSKGIKKIDTNYDERTPGKGFYHDVLYYMTLGIDKNFDDGSDMYTDIQVEIMELEEELSDKITDPIEHSAEEDFETEFNFCDGHHRWSLYDEDYTTYFITKDDLDDNIKYLAEVDNIWTNEWVRQRYDENSKNHAESDYPNEWFTPDEIKKYIEDNLMPETDKERELDNKLSEIYEAIPSSLDYYRFPESWEENGLAEFVRDIYKIPTTNM